MSEALRKPMNIEDRSLGKFISKCASLGDLSLRFYTHKPYKMPKQHLLHVRIRMQGNDCYDRVSVLTDWLKYYFVVIRREAFQEDKYCYFDYHIILGK